MRSLVLAFACLVLAGSMVAQQGSLPATSSTSQDPDRAQIEAVLKSYEEAYAHHDLEALLAIWPGLRNQEKEFKKARWHLKDDPDVFSEKMSLEPIRWDIGKDQAMVNCNRSEVYVRLETLSQVGLGDVRTATGQLPDPAAVPSKKIVKKNDNVTFSLKKQEDRWIISSLSEKK